MRKGQPHGQRVGWMPSGRDFVRRLDRDGDGKVSRQEFDGPPEHFNQLDRNRDGFLSEDEAPQGRLLIERGNRQNTAKEFNLKPQQHVLFAVCGVSQPNLDNNRLIAVTKITSVSRFQRLSFVCSTLAE